MEHGEREASSLEPALEVLPGPVGLAGFPFQAEPVQPLILAHSTAICRLAVSPQKLEQSCSGSLSRHIRYQSNFLTLIAS